MVSRSVGTPEIVDQDASDQGASMSTVAAVDGAKPSSGAETPLEIVDPRPQHGDVFPQRRQVTLEDFPAAPLVGEQRLDAAESLNDGLVFLLETLQPTIDRVEVPERVGAEAGEILANFATVPAYFLELPVDGLEPPVDRVEPPVHGLEALIDGLEPLIDRIEALIDGLEALIDPLEALIDPLEALIDGLEPPIDRIEPLAEEGEELLILGGRHAVTTTAIPDSVQGLDSSTPTRLHGWQRQ
jgi:hypothetical protein